MLLSPHRLGSMFSSSYLMPLICGTQWGSNDTHLEPWLTSTLDRLCLHWCKVGLPLASTFWMVVGLQTKATNSTTILTFSCKLVLYMSMLICLDSYTSHTGSAIMLHVMLLRRFCIMMQFLHSLIVLNCKTFILLDISCNLIDKNMLELSPNSFIGVFSM